MSTETIISKQRWNSKRAMSIPQVNPFSFSLPNPNAASPNRTSHQMFFAQRHIYLGTNVLPHETSASPCPATLQQSLGHTETQFLFSASTSSTPAGAGVGANIIVPPITVTVKARLEWMILPGGTRKYGQAAGITPVRGGGGSGGRSRFLTLSLPDSLVHLERRIKCNSFGRNYNTIVTAETLV